jgi:acyl-CoA synthetase (AMP-forming)/AMP-acid ligase II
VRAGDRVALLAGNSAAFAQVVFGVARAGAVLVPLNLRLAAEEIRWQLEDCEASLLVTDRAEWLSGETGGTSGPGRPLPNPPLEGEGTLLSRLRVVSLECGCT